MKYLLPLLLLSSCAPQVQYTTGPAGATGPQGIPGTNGTNGIDGTNAPPCHVSPVERGVVLTCPDGSTQTILDGLAGPDGAPGTVVNAVQFCPGVPVSYPSSFPEVGLCFGGNLFAVYWNGSQAFFTEIPPGQYLSTSPQGCTFTVTPNCGVSQ